MTYKLQLLEYLYLRLFLEKKSTDSKFLKQYLKLVMDSGKWVWERSTLLFTNWRRKTLLPLAGEMRDKKTEEEQGDATISSLEKALQPWNQFSHSEPTYLHGSPLEESLVLENKANLEIEVLTEFLVKEEARLELLEKVSELELRKRKYKKSDPVETWSSRWVCSPIAYLFPADRREEWLGDLYELN